MIQVYELATTGGTTASGSWSANTNRITGGILGHMYIGFTTTSTTFDFKLIDGSNRNVIELTTITGILNREYQIPIRGIYTMQITNASADEAFKLRFAIRDV